MRPNEVAKLPLMRPRSNSLRRRFGRTTWSFGSLCGVVVPLACGDCRRAVIRKTRLPFSQDEHRVSSEPIRAQQGCAPRTPTPNKTHGV